MLINEENLRYLIRHKYALKEGREERKYRQKMRQEKRSQLKNATSPEERKRIRQDFKRKRKEARDSDYFEASDTGETLEELLNLQIRDSAYMYVVDKVKRIIPEINRIEQSYAGIKLIATLQSRKEKRFTIGQLKRFIKMGLIATREGDYREATDNFCAAFVLVKSPKTQDEEKKVVITDNVKETLYDLCKSYERGVFKKREEEDESKNSQRKKSNDAQCVMDIQKNLNTLNANSKTIDKLSIDGKWGSATSGAWRAAVGVYVANGDVYNKITITDEIHKNLLNSWPEGAKQTGYDADLCGARDFIDDILINVEKGGTIFTPDDRKPIIDEDINVWQESRNMERSYTWDDLPIREALTVGGGISINYLYTPKEFKTHYKPTSSYTSGRKLLFKYLVDFGAEKGIDVFDYQHDRSIARHAGGPNANSTTETALYYHAKDEVLLIDALGNDQMIRDIVVYNNKIYHKNFTPDKYTPRSEHQIEGGVKDPNSEEGIQQDSQTQRISEMLLKEQQLKNLIKKLLFEEEEKSTAVEQNVEGGISGEDVVQDYDALLDNLQAFEDGDIDLDIDDTKLAKAGMSKEELESVLAQTGTFLGSFAEAMYDTYPETQFSKKDLRKAKRQLKTFKKRRSKAFEKGKKGRVRDPGAAVDYYNKEAAQAALNIQDNAKAEINKNLSVATTMMRAGNNDGAAEYLQRIVNMLKNQDKIKQDDSNVENARNILESLIAILRTDKETKPEDIRDLELASKKSGSDKPSDPLTPGQASDLSKFQNNDRVFPIVANYKYSSSEAMRIIRAQLNQISGQVGTPLALLPATGKWNAAVTEHWENALRAHSTYLGISDGQEKLPWGELSEIVRYPSTKEGAIALLDDIGGLEAGNPRKQSGGSSSGGGKKPPGDKKPPSGQSQEEMMDIIVFKKIPAKAGATTTKKVDLKKIPANLVAVTKASPFFTNPIVRNTLEGLGSPGTTYGKKQAPIGVDLYFEFPNTIYIDGDGFANHILKSYKIVEENGSYFYVHQE
jgi:hypothetical protein